MSEKKKGFNDFFASTLDSGIFLSQWSNFFFATFAIKSSSQLVCSEYVDGVYERPSLLQMLICQMPERKKKHHLCPQRDVIMTQRNPEEEATDGENPPDHNKPHFLHQIIKKKRHQLKVLAVSPEKQKYLPVKSPNSTSAYMVNHHPASSVVLCCRDVASGRDNKYKKRAWAFTNTHLSGGPGWS